MKKLDLKKVDERRIEIGMTKRELAKRIGVSPPAIVQMFSKGISNPLLSTGLGIAEALECDITDLLEDDLDEEEQAA